MLFRSVYDHKQVREIEVKGRCVDQGLPKVIKLNSKEMIEALAEPVSAILEAVCTVIENTPPELIEDILRNGIVMTGGGSLLYGFDRLIMHATGVKTRVADDAVSCVAIGTGISIENIDLLSEGTTTVSRDRRNRV